MFIVFSKNDKQEFKVDQKVINASVLLKNICELTVANSEPIHVDCSSACLQTFIKLINHYDDIDKNYHDIEFEKNLFKDFDDCKLAELIKEMCLLDSDFFFDSIADLILERIKAMEWKEMQEYFELEDDYTIVEREFIEKNLLEFLLSINPVDTNESSELAFPFSGTNFTTLKNKFFCPMNVLVARIIQRSNSTTALYLSLINKAIKKENDRHPIKVQLFYGGEPWVIEIESISRVQRFLLSSDKYDEKYFDIIKNRKLIADETIELRYDSKNSISQGVLRCSSFDFVILGKAETLEIKFCYNSEQISYFDIQKCPFYFIFYNLYRISLHFEEFYQKLIATDLSKEIKICAYNAFEFFPLDSGYLTIKKKSKASKFYELRIDHGRTEYKCLPNFKNFLSNYMEDDAVIISDSKIFNISNCYDRKEAHYVYDLLDAINSLNEKEIQEYCKCKTGCKKNTNCKCQKLKRIGNTKCHNNINTCTNMHT